MPSVGDFVSLRSWGSIVILVKVSIAVKRHHDHRNSNKGKHLIVVVAYSFRGSIHYHHGGENDSMQTDMMLENSTSCRQQEMNRCCGSAFSQ